MLFTVFAGFARSYFLAGIFRAPLPSLIIHFHGAAFTTWILLLVTQTSLVSAGRVDIHRRLGIAGFFLACFMVVVGVLAGTNSLVRGSAPPGLDALAFYIVPLSDMVLFAALVSFAFRLRRDAAAHKRLIYIATTLLLTAAIARLPFSFSSRSPARAAILSYVLLLILAAYDLWSTRKIHRVTLWAGALLIFVQQLRGPFSQTALWHTFASWVQTHAR